jgi:hypothetical protein
VGHLAEIGGNSVSKMRAGFQFKNSMTGFSNRITKSCSVTMRNPIERRLVSAACRSTIIQYGPGTLNLFQNIGCLAGPDEGFGVIVLVDVVADGQDQLRHVGEHGTSQCDHHRAVLEKKWKARHYQTAAIAGADPALLAACDRSELAMFATYLVTGFREQEVMHLFWSDVSFQLRTIRVTAKPDLSDSFPNDLKNARSPSRGSSQAS